MNSHAYKPVEKATLGYQLANRGSEHFYSFCGVAELKCCQVTLVIGARSKSFYCLRVGQPRFQKVPAPRDEGVRI